MKKIHESMKKKFTSDGAEFDTTLELFENTFYDLQNGALVGYDVLK